MDRKKKTTSKLERIRQNGFCLHTLLETK